MDFSFYNLGAFFIKGKFFFFGWGLKRRLNSLKGWADLGERCQREKDAKELP